jgi:hypothetical protein
VVALPNEQSVRSDGGKNSSSAGAERGLQTQARIVHQQPQQQRSQHYQQRSEGQEGTALVVECPQMACLGGRMSIMYVHADSLPVLALVIKICVEKICLEMA